MKETVYLLAGQKKIEDEYKDPNMLPKINKSYMAGTMESIQEYLRSCHGVARAPLAYVIRKTITVQTLGDYLMYASPDNKMIARMLHLPPYKNKLLSEKDVQRVQIGMAEYKIDNQMVYDVLDQICKDTDLYSNVPRGMEEGHFMPSTSGG